MALINLKDIPLPGERSSRFIDAPLVQDEGIHKQLRHDHDWVGELEFSSCLHPDVRDYYVRLANVFSLGALYYPLYTICTQLSSMALELALNTRFRFETRYGLGLRGLLEHATRRHLLKFENTSVVKEIHRKSTEFAAMIPRHCEPKQISEIARNRAEMLTKLLPQIRNSAAHPAFASLVDPPMAYKSLQQSLEFANIVFEESEPALKQFVDDAAIRMDEVSVVEMRPANPGRKAGSSCCRLSTTLQACQAIEKAARSFGIFLKASMAFQALRDLSLVPNTADGVEDLFKKKATCQDRLSDGQASSCLALLENLSVAEARFAREMLFEHKGRRVSVKSVRTGNSCKWLLVLESDRHQSSCTIRADELSYYSLLKAGLASSLDAASKEIRGLSTILGQKPDAFRWNQIVWPRCSDYS